MIGCLVSTYNEEKKEMKRSKIQGLAFGGLAALLWVASAGAAEVAIVNGKPLSAEEVKRALVGANEGQRAAVLRDPVAKKRFVNDLIEQEILFQQAQKEKIDQTAEFQAAVEAFKRQYLANQLFSRHLSVKATEEAAKNYYRNHLSQFSTDSVHVQHILISDEFTARNLLAEIQKPSSDFQVIAEKNSKDPTAKFNRGEVGWITHSSPLAREFKDAAFSAEKGKVVGPVQTAFGYHLIKVVDRKVGKPLQYDEVELQVKASLREELSRSYLIQLKKTAQVKLNDKAIESL